MLGEELIALLDVAEDPGEELDAALREGARRWLRELALGAEPAEAAVGYRGGVDALGVELATDDVALVLLPSAPPGAQDNRCAAPLRGGLRISTVRRPSIW